MISSVSARATMDGMAVCIYLNVDDRTTTRMSVDEAKSLWLDLSAAIDEVAPKLQAELDKTLRSV